MKRIQWVRVGLAAVAIAASVWMLLTFFPIEPCAPDEPLQNSLRMLVPGCGLYE